MLTMCAFDTPPTCQNRRKTRTPGRRSGGRSGGWVTLSMLSLILASSGPIQTSGCEEVTVKRESFVGLRKLADQPREPRKLTPLEERISQGGWTILLAYFPGGDTEAKAKVFANRLESEAGLTDVWTMSNSQGTRVYCGVFKTTAEGAAQAMLAKVRQTELDAVRYFENSEMVTIGGSTTGNDLHPLNVGQYSGMYTLQVAAFDENYPGGRHAGAEDYAMKLREEGTDAYFYHGPNRSMVTVGMFAYDQAFRSIANPNAPGTFIDAYTEKVQALQKQHPYNLVNGYTLLQRGSRDKQAREQESQLVRIP